MFDVYNEYCPDKTYASLLRIEWVSLTSFDVNIFQVKEADYLTFECEVRAYGNDEDLPPPCTSQRRKRRAVDDMATMTRDKGTFYIFIITSNLKLSLTKFYICKNYKSIVHFENWTWCTPTRRNQEFKCKSNLFNLNSCSTYFSRITL